MLGGWGVGGGSSCLPLAGLHFSSQSAELGLNWSGHVAAGWRLQKGRKESPHKKKIEERSRVGGGEGGLKRERHHDAICSLSTAPQMWSGT